jgi:DNA-binding MurR/RpiR family transcriptional regulator
MSNILHAIQEGSVRLHRMEKKLADFILSRPQEIPRMGITELAMLSGASTATITRFCKLLYFSGFTEFKLKLAEELAQAQAHSLQTETYQDIVAGNPVHSIIAAMEANHVRSITDTTRLLDVAMVQSAVQALRGARQIDLYGVATSGIVAEDFYQKLIRIGKRAFYSSDPHLQITSASGLGGGDVAIGISYSGETLETIDAVRCAKEQGALTITLTKYGKNTLSTLADIPLFASSLEEGMRRGDLASRIAQLHVIDILFVALVSEQFGDYVPRLEQSFQKVKKYRKEKGK